MRETEDAIAAARAPGALAVETESAALYGLARAQNRPVLCFAHVTNQIARIEGDFEKGQADGTRSSLDVIVTAARALWLWSYRRVPGALMSGSFRDSDA